MTKQRARVGSIDPSAAGPHLTDREVVSLLRKTLAYSRRHDYTGWDYGDGMSSRLLQALPIESKWLNIAFQETVKRPPINLRPLFLVEQRRNFKGTALFAMANRTCYQLTDGAGEHTDLDVRAETIRLLDWLLDNQCPGYSGFCGGHQHRLQHLNGQVGDPTDPDVVSTSYAVRALLSNADLGDRYLQAARSAAQFVVEDLDYREVEDGAIIDYHLNHGDHYTINAGALGARLFLDLYVAVGDETHLDRATALLDHIAGLQTDRGGWYYRDPADASHLSMDTHHNGFVIESFQRYAEVADDARYTDTLDRALPFYRSLFEADGAPRFDESAAYPRDIHAATQGILVFTYAGEFGRARTVIQWVLDNLYVGDGRYYFRKHRFYTQRITLMRWCQAWMAYALAEHLRVTSQEPPQRRRQLPLASCQHRE
ncbi:antibiotic ABC transporter permease [Halapricum desulfuricans]|uniref:antibiotic ABC transporter permease n=1 Tax=Halapricum desulfuricans TaxID=2841257 RepID=UPI001E5196B7|nr:antibiotic ABC transporter permease [Halapricum desulfuricans]